MLRKEEKEAFKELIERGVEVTAIMTPGAPGSVS